jgi:hypothetical protein
VIVRYLGFDLVRVDAPPGRWLVAVPYMGIAGFARSLAAAKGLARNTVVR